MQITSILPNVQNNAYNSKLNSQCKTTETIEKDLETDINNYSFSNDNNLVDIFGSINFTSRLYVWQRTYTAGEAVDQAYGNATAPNIFGNNTSLTGISKEEYINYRKELGMDYSIDWLQLQNDLNTTGNDYGSSNDAIDYFAARYAVLKDRINSQPKSNISNQLSKLDEYFTKSIKNLANCMATDLDSKLLKYEISGEKETINKSLLASFDKKSSYYTELIKNSPDYAGIEGTNFEWLASDDRFMAASLRKISNSDKCELNSSKGGYKIFSDQYDESKLYTQKELSSLNIIIESMDNSFSIQNISSSSSEEEVGFFLGSKALEIGIASKVSNFGEKMNKLTNRLFDKYLNQFIDFCNENIDKTRNDNKVAIVHSNEAYYDKETIVHIANKIKNTYKDGNSIEDSLKVGYKEACSSYLKRQKEYSTELRYNTKENELPYFLKYFNKSPSPQKFIVPRLSTKDGILSRFKNFKTALINGDYYYSPQKVNIKKTFNIGRSQNIYDVKV